ncbi:unnamed protein product, partial [Staurois parvus]
MALMGTGGWHCRAHVGGTDGCRWAALMSTSGRQRWTQVCGTGGR